MRAYVIEEAGGPENLVLRELPDPTPVDGQVTIRVRAFGLHRSEWFTRRGDSPSVHFPRVLGIECVGEVVAAPGTDLSPGQRVAALALPWAARGRRRPRRRRQRRARSVHARPPHARPHGSVREARRRPPRDGREHGEWEDRRGGLKAATTVAGAASSRGRTIRPDGCPNRALSSVIGKEATR
jgi:NADPH:quinone reductase-like Zn-dependent oxidoreductase